MMQNRQTAAKYLDRIVVEGLLDKFKLGRENYYVNTRLVNLFVNHRDNSDNVITIESVTDKG